MKVQWLVTTRSVPFAPYLSKGKVESQNVPDSYRADLMVGPRLRRSGNLASHETLRGAMPRRKQARRTSVRDIRAILRLTYEQGLSVREVAERLKIGKTSVSTYLLRARVGAVELAVGAGLR